MYATAMVKRAVMTTSGKHIYACINMAKYYGACLDCQLGFSEIQAELTNLPIIPNFLPN